MWGEGFGGVWEDETCVGCVHMRYVRDALETHKERSWPT